MGKRMKWRLIQSGHQDGYTNMAIDEAMFALAGKRHMPPTLRLYGWDPPAISLGYFQTIGISMSLLPSPLGGEGMGEGEISRKVEEIRRDKGIDIVRRLTGGGAILHDQELTYCLVAPLKGSVIPADVSGSYDLICRAVIDGLQALGIDVQTRSDAAARSGNRAVSKQREPFFCFARPSKYDIVYKGKKLVGSAQRRKNGILLHHGSILLDGEQNPETSIGVNSTLGRQVGFKEISKNIGRGFGRELSIELIPCELTKKEWELSQHLIKTKRKDKGTVSKRGENQ